jgi:hypothetical protein
MNPLENADLREKLRSESIVTLIEGNAFATNETLAQGIAEGGSIKELLNALTFSTITVTLLWLQGRGVYIPADVCEALQIEVRNA